MSIVGLMKRLSLKSLGASLTVISVIKELRYVFLGAPSSLLLLTISFSRLSSMLLTAALSPPASTLGVSATFLSGVKVVSLTRTMDMSNLVGDSPSLVSICK